MAEAAEYLISSLDGVHLWKHPILFFLSTALERKFIAQSKRRNSTNRKEAISLDTKTVLQKSHKIVSELRYKKAASKYGAWKFEAFRLTVLMTK